MQSLCPNYTGTRDQRRDVSRPGRCQGNVGTIPCDRRGEGGWGAEPGSLFVHDFPEINGVGTHWGGSVLGFVNGFGGFRVHINNSLRSLSVIHVYIRGIPSLVLRG